MKLYDRVMERWHVPFHVIEAEWTNSQFYGMVRAMIENEEHDRDRAEEARAEQSGDNAYVDAMPDNVEPYPFLKSKREG